MKKPLLSLLPVATFALGCVYSSIMCKIPKDELTISHILRLKIAICEYAKETGSFPNTLEVLVNAGITEKGIILDGWGDPLKYEVLNGETANLASYCGASKVSAYENIRHTISATITRSDWDDDEGLERE